MAKVFLLICGFLLIYSGDVFSQEKARIYGTVKDKAGKPIEGANLVLEGTIDGATSDKEGKYEFETRKTGEFSLLITAMGYSEQAIAISIVEGQQTELNIVVSKEVTTDEIVVTASSFVTGENSKLTLTPLEIVRIPGADADLYRAITTFPGSNQVDEGSRIAVRGGDPGEVLTILDQASLYNPFIFDNASNTSSYSTVNPWGLKGINFTSGGFSAQFGNVLSAVLDLQSYDMPRTTGMFAIVGAGLSSLAGSYRTDDNKLGATFQGTVSYLQPFLELHGQADLYNPIPETQGLGGTITYKPDDNSTLKLYGNYSRDKVGMFTTSPTFDGYFNSKSNSIFGNLKYSTNLTSTSLFEISTSYSRYNSDIGFGVLNNNNISSYGKIRADYTTPINSTIDLKTGAEYEYNEYKADGIAPRFSYNIRPGAPTESYSSALHSGRIGGYMETKLKMIENIYAITGIRSDYNTLSQKFSVDPRLSLVYRLSENSYIKGATGIYHQYTSLGNNINGNNNDLGPEEAIHYILGYEYNDEGDLIVRLEGYYKDYTNLVALDTAGGFNRYNNNGQGFAKGIDFFLKKRFRGKFTGWISYSFVDSKRRQYGNLFETSANYDITHTMSVVGSYNITNDLTAGATLRLSTGKPYTPVIGSTFDPVNNAYIPTYADNNSDRFPTYKRIDVNLQYVFSILDRFAVAFVALNNVLDEQNLFTYTYNFDYSQKIPVVSTNERTIYFGVGMAF
jgi:vitamin B12 transporter